jgi:hypothetical protein
VGLEVEWAELVQAEDDLGFAVFGYDLAVGEGVEVLDPGLLGRVVGLAGGLEGLQALKGDAFLAEQHAQALVADVVDHLLGDQEVGQLGQTPGRKGLVVLDRLGLGDLLDLASLGQCERLGPSAFVLGVEGVEAVGVAVVDHIPHPVGAGEGHLGDLRYRHALRGQQDHLGPSPRHHRAGAAADSPQQPISLIVIDLVCARVQPSAHGHSQTPCREALCTARRYDRANVA